MEGFNNGSTFSNNSSSSASLDGSSPTNQENEEATIEEIIEAVAKVEKLAKNGEFPLEKLQEMKEKLKEKYPNISFISTQNESQEPENDNHFQAGFMRPSEYVNHVHQLQMNALINQQMNVISNQSYQQCMSTLGMSWKPHYTHPYSVANPFQHVMYPNYYNNGFNNGLMYGDPMQMAMMMGNTTSQSRSRRSTINDPSNTSAISLLENLVGESDDE